MQTAKRIPPNLRELRARKRREWSSLKAGEVVEISVELGRAYNLEIRGSRKFCAGLEMPRNAELRITSVTQCEIVGFLTIKEQSGGRLPTRKCLIRNGIAVLDGPEFYCGHELPTYAPF